VLSVLLAECEESTLFTDWNSSYPTGSPIGGFQAPRLLRLNILSVQGGGHGVATVRRILASPFARPSGKVCLCPIQTLSPVRPWLTTASVLLSLPPRTGVKTYFPHPETKPAHFQKPDVLELLLPFVEGLKYGDEIKLIIPAEQMIIEGANT